MNAVACPRKFGPHAICGAIVELTTVDGRLVEWCWACDRFARGICRECPQAVNGVRGRSRRCAVHKKAAALAESARYRDRNRAEYNQRQKLYMRLPDVRARNIVTVRTWRRANPGKVRAQRKRREFRQYIAARSVA